MLYIIIPPFFAPTILFPHAKLVCFQLGAEKKQKVQTSVFRCNCICCNPKHDFLGRCCCCCCSRNLASCFSLFSMTFTVFCICTQTRFLGSLLLLLLLFSNSIVVLYDFHFVASNLSRCRPCHPYPYRFLTYIHMVGTTDKPTPVKKQHDDFVQCVVECKVQYYCSCSSHLSPTIL